MNRRTVAASIAAATLTVTALAVPQSAGASTPKLHCSASASPSHPSDYSYVHINVIAKVGSKPARKAAVRTTAHYKTTDTSHSGRTNTKGAASVEFYISDASKGHRVPVSVTVKTTHKSASCSTFFTPR